MNLLPKIEMLQGKSKHIHQNHLQYFHEKKIYVILIAITL